MKQSSYNYLKPAEMKTALRLFNVKRFFNFKNLIFLFLAMILFNLSGCNNGKQLTNSNYLINKLNVLYVDKASFQMWAANHDTKIMFRFSFTGNQITLTGWAPKANDDDDAYDEANTLPLQISSETKQLTGNKLYFGNLRLSRADVRALKSLLNKPGAAYLVFIPENFAASPEQIDYDIFISKSPNSSGIIPSLHGNAKADPSPPANRK